MGAPGPRPARSGADRGCLTPTRLPRSARPPLSTPVAILLGAGAGLRLWQYLADASLWADEANMALNLVGRSLGGLLTPLDHHQVAPLGWLVLEKGAVTILGEGERALRLVPFLASLAALPLFAALARRVLTGLAAPLAVGLFAIAQPLVFYAAQVKLYASDVLAALALLLMALQARERGLTGRRALALAAVGVAVPWVSLAAVLVLAGVGGALGWLALRAGDRRTLGWLAVVGVAWAASGIAAVTLVRQGLSADDQLYLQRFWGVAFWPLPPRSPADLVWPLARLAGVFGGGGLRYPVPGLFAVLAAVGVVVGARRAPAATLVLAAPVLAALGASAVRVYPFAPRVVLFVVPAFVLWVAAGVEGLRTAGARPWRWLGVGAGVAVTGLALWGLIRHPPPYRPEHLRPILAAVAADRQPGDRIYVYYGAEMAFRYYADRFGFREGEYMMGGCWRGQPRAYLAELDRFRGSRRLWLVLAHARAELAEEPLLLGYLDAIGRRVASHRWVPHPRDGGAAGAAGHLYDLSDARRLGAAAAATFAVPAPGGGARLGWSCFPPAG